MFWRKPVSVLLFERELKRSFCAMFRGWGVGLGGFRISLGARRPRPMFLYIPEDRPLPPLQTPSQLWSLGYLFQRLAEMCQYELWNHVASALRAQTMLVESATSALSTQTMLVESATNAFKCTDYSGAAKKGSIRQLDTS